MRARLTSGGLSRSTLTKRSKKARTPRVLTLEQQARKYQRRQETRAAIANWSETR